MARSADKPYAVVTFLEPWADGKIIRDQAPALALAEGPLVAFGASSCGSLRGVAPILPGTVSALGVRGTGRTQPRA